MKKLKIKGLGIEITRKCNRKCKHCLKGEAQDVTISKEIIDKIFTDVQECEEIILFGGEPLLEMDSIEYMVDKIIENNCTTDKIQLTTNATIRDQRICNILKKFCQSAENRFALLRISNDSFHNINDVKPTLDFYNSIINKINKELEKNAIIIKLELENGDKNIPIIAYSGRAKKYVDTHKHLFIPFGKTKVKCPYNFNHRIRIINNKVMCRLRIAANGNLGIDEPRSFEQDDNLAFGNILNDDISSLIMKHNEDCLLRCEEMEDITTFSDLGDFLPGAKNDSKIYFKIVGMIFKKIHSERIIAKQKYNHIPAQDIIENIPFPTIKKLPYIVERIYNEYNNSVMNPYSYNEVLERVKNIVANEDFYFYPDTNEEYGFGFSHSYNNLLSSPAFITLKELNEKYKNGELVYDNDKVFKCDADK